MAMFNSWIKSVKLFTLANDNLIQTTTLKHIITLETLYLNITEHCDIKTEYFMNNFYPLTIATTITLPHVYVKSQKELKVD